jgi:hypothetical protein
MNLDTKSFFTKTFIFFLIFWGMLNFIQAWLTPLNSDEAYYWMYSNNLDWGFFDHPPMIALMIRIGYFFVHNELGIRFLVVLSELVAIIVIWLLTYKDRREKYENILFFIMLLVIFPVFNIYGFIATPDAPLILFSALFLLTYRRFSENGNWKNTLFLGISMAALVYSKYHGIILIFLVILSNPRLLKNKGFYLASVMSVILLLPHLFWQYSNGFPSLKYHFVERVSGFDPGHVPEYLLNQLIVHNPLILPVTVWLMLKTRAKNRFEKTLRYIVTGFLIFFLIASFRYHVEPQWTSLICIPLIIILFNNLDYKPWIGDYIKRITIFFFPAILLVRIALMADFLPVSFLKDEYHNRRKWANEIADLAGYRPVIFTNSYQNASTYTFYTGKFAHSLDNLNYRKTQYDLWPFEEKVHGEEVLYIPHYLTYDYKKNLTKYSLPDGDSLFFRVFKDFQSLQRECVILKDDLYLFRKSAINKIHLQIFNPYPYPIKIKHKELPIQFQIAFVKNGSMESRLNLELPDDIVSINVGDTISADCTFTLGELPTGRYKLAICSQAGIIYDVYNSRFRDVKITD